MLRQFYDLALVEGEGLGTAYEYTAKSEILKSYLKSRKVLVYAQDLSRNVIAT